MSVQLKPLSVMLVKAQAEGSAPAIITFPSGMANMRGYRSPTGGSPLLPTWPIFVVVPSPPIVAGGVNSSTSLLMTVGFRPDSSRPLMIGTLPLDILIPLGYQRPCSIFGCSRQVSVNGLNV
jgi:hypothetical protein